MNKLDKEATKRFEELRTTSMEDPVLMSDNDAETVIEFIAKEKQLSKQEERARIIPKIHKIRAGCPAKSFARQQAKELLKELMGVEK